MTRTEQADISAELEGFGARIREMRLAKGITQRDFAKAVGATQCMIWMWETGKNLPQAKHLLTLCRALETSPNELLGWKPVKRSTLTGKQSLDLKGRMAAEEKPKRRRKKQEEKTREKADNLHYIITRPELMTMNQLKKNLCWPTPKNGCKNCSSPCKYGMELEKRKEGMKHGGQDGKGV